MYLFQKSTSDPEHPFSNFAYGNKKTLKKEPERMGIDMLRALQVFFEEHYSAEQMQMVILGRDSLDELQSMVVDQFSAVPNRGHKVEEVTTMPNLKSSLPAIFRINSGYDRKCELGIWWQVPGTQNHYREKPLRFIAHLLSLEGEGSISHVLKQKKLATACSASINDLSGFCLLQVSFGGVHLKRINSNLKEILSVVFAYLSMLRTVDVNILKSHYMRLHRERLSQLRYSGKSSPGYCRELARTLRFHDPIDCIKVHGFLHFNDTLIREYLAYLSPDNIRIEIISPDFKEQADRTEPWFDIKYSVEYPKPFNRSSTSYAVYLPVLVMSASSQAPLIAPSRQHRVARSGRRLMQLSSGIGHRLWYKLSSASAVLPPPLPRMALLARFTSRFTVASTRNVLLTRLFAILLARKQLIDKVELDKPLVKECGVDIFVSSFEGGLDILFEGNGLPDDVRIVFDAILKTIKNFTFEPDDFERAKTILSRCFQPKGIREIADRAYILSSFSNLSMHSKSYEELSLISFSSMVESIPLILEEGYWEILVHGDVEREEALAFSNDLLQLTSVGCDEISTPFKILPAWFSCVEMLFPSRSKPLRVLRLPAGTVSIIRTSPIPGEKNSCAKIIFQLGQFPQS